MLGRWRGTPTNDTRDVELNAIGVLKRREIEARILAPLVEASGREFGRERVLQIVRETIVGIAWDQGRQLCRSALGHQIVPASQQVVAITPVFLLAWVLRLFCNSRIGEVGAAWHSQQAPDEMQALADDLPRRSSVPAFWHRPSEEC